ncbi:unnamed protein product, partial [Brassica rapa subsp. trilocularis]
NSQNNHQKDWITIYTYTSYKPHFYYIYAHIIVFVYSYTHI